jgi:hypothetical protein
MSRPVAPFCNHVIDAFGTIIQFGGCFAQEYDKTVEINDRARAGVTAKTRVKLISAQSQLRLLATGPAALAMAGLAAAVANKSFMTFLSEYSF